MSNDVISDFEKRLEGASRGGDVSNSILPNTLYERVEDMSPDGKLQLIVQEDGDIIVSVIENHEHRGFQWASVEFCTLGSGGGRSRHTREALRALIIAIQKDNEERPIL